MFADGLALNGNAPKIFSRTNRWGLPYVAVGTNCAFGLLAYMSVSGGAGRVFGWYVLNIASATALYSLLHRLQVLKHDLRRGSHELVRHLRHVRPVLRGHEGAGHRPHEAAVLLAPAAVRGLVRRVLDRHHLLRTFPSLPSDLDRL